MKSIQPSLKLNVLILIMLLISFSSSHSQGGYFNMGLTSITNKGFNPGFSFGGGYRGGIISIGFAGDYFGIIKDKAKFGIASIDLRGYLINKGTSPYFSIQPGFVLYDNEFYGIRTRGHLAGAVNLGLDAHFKEDSPGMNFYVGYQFVSFRIDKSYISDGSYFKAGINLTLK
jgi:hypothetical protein